MPEALTAAAPRYRSAREDVAQLNASDILAVGEKDGRNSWETAEAIDRWRDETLRYGYEVHNEAPERRGDWYWDNRAKLDNQTWEAKRALLARASAEVAASIYPEPDQQRAAWGRIQAAGFDGEKLFEVNGENQEQALRDRAVLQRWQQTVDSGKFEGPPNPIVNQPVKQGGTTLATYDVRQADKDGTLEARIKIDPKSANEAVTDYLRGSTADNSGVSKIVRLPAITRERIESELAATVKAREARETELATPTRTGGFADSSSSGGPVETTRTQEQIDGDQELFRLKVREAVLSSPGASAALVHEDIENTIKTDPEMSGKVGQVDLGEDIWKGIQSGVLRTGYGVDDIAKLIKGDAEGVYSKENAAGLSEALAAIDEVYPGSTRWMFEGGTIKKGIVQGAQAVGEMLPTMVGPQLLTKGALVAAGRSGIMRAGVNPGLFSSTAGISPMAYGGSLFGTDTEIAAETDPERRAKLESGRRARAAWTAVSEVATESIFRGNQMFQRAVPSVRKELLRRGLQIPQEGIEEVIQKGIETNVIDPATIGRYDAAGLDEYLSAFVAGAVAAGGLQAASVATVPGAVQAERDALIRKIAGMIADSGTPDTRSQEEIDRDSGQGLMFDDRQSAAPSRSGSRGASSSLASRAGGSGIRDTGMPSGTDPRSFSLPALVQLSKALGLDPTVNPKLKSALGRFTAKRVGGAVQPLAVQTRKGLFRDPDLATEVLAHEIGHFIDYTAATEKGARFHQRLAPLSKGNWESIFPTLRAGYPADTPAKKAMAEQIRKEAIDLSSQWRGPFQLNDDYRNSAPELYADFLSALLNAPQFAKRVAPNVYEGFFNGLSQKPKVAAAYQEMQRLLSGDLVTDAILEKLDANQKAAMDKVIDLARPNRIPLKERTQEMILKGREQFLNKWARVASKEGFRRSIQGDSFTSQLELNDGFAVRERSLFNDDIRQRVTDPLREAGVEDRHFARFLIFNRIIEDRRATGIWIENNPSDAREIMAWMATEFGSSPAIQSEIATAPDASLYNVGARMIRELQDKGLDAEKVAKVENKALLGGVLPDALKGKAEKFITAFNVRGFMLNTEGIDVATAREGLRKTRDEIGAPKYTAIEKAAQELFAITRPITEAAINLGMYSKAVADEVLRPNAGNYIPFQVLEYFDGDVSAAIREGKGSTKALNDPLTALSLHTQALLGWMQRQKTSLLLEQWAKAFAIPMEDSGPMTKYGGRLGNDKQDVVLVWRDGRPHSVSFDEPGIAAAANFFDELNLVGAIAQAGGGIFARAFTKYALGFIAYTNAIRDPKTSAERLGISATIRNYAKSAKIAKAYAKAAATGEALTPEIRELVKSGVLPPPDQSFFRLLTDTEIRDSINAGLSARDVVKGRSRMVHDTRFNRVVEAIDRPFVYLGALTESISKIAASKTLKEKGFSDADVVKLARLVGIPNPGLGGTRMKTASAFSLFFRPIVQGWRAERTFLVNPKTRGGYMMRMALAEFLPTTLMFLAGAGILKTVLESLGLDPGDDLEEFFKSLSQYKKESSMVVPLFWWTPNGFKPVWGHKKDEIESNWIAWGLRIPRSEGGRLWGSLTWNALAETNENTKSPDSTRTWTRWAGSHLPGLNPAIDTFLKDFQMLQGVNPLDSFRNQQIINRTDWDAGGMDRFRAALAWNLGQISGGFYRPETAADPNGLTDAQKIVRSIGPLRAAFTFDNYRDARQRAIDDAEKSKVAAKTKKALGSKATELIALGSSLERIGVSRNAAQDEKYDLFLEFNRKRWEGKSGLREKLRQAVADGDKAEVESITEYLEQEAERYLGYVRSVK